MRAFAALALLLSSAAFAVPRRADTDSSVQPVPASDINRDAVAAQTPYLSTSRKFIAFSPIAHNASGRQPGSPNAATLATHWRRAKEETLDCASTKGTLFAGYGRIVGVTVGASAGVVMASPTFFGTAGGALGGALGGAMLGDVAGRAVGWGGCAAYHYGRELIRRSP